MEACFLQPIDVIKTRLQLDHTGQYKGARSALPWHTCSCLLLGGAISVFVCFVCSVLHSGRQTSLVCQSCTICCVHKQVKVS